MNIDDISEQAYEDLKGLMDVTRDDIAMILDECLTKTVIALRQSETVNLSSLGAFYIGGEPREVNHVAPLDLLEPWPASDLLSGCEIDILDISIRMAQDLQDYVDAGVEAGSKMSATKHLVEQWERVYRHAQATRHCSGNPQHSGAIVNDKQKPNATRKVRQKPTMGARQPRAPISRQIGAIEKQIATLRRSYTDPRDGTMDPDAAHEVFCLESAVESLKILSH